MHTAPSQRDVGVMNTLAHSADCPRCRIAMTHVAITPHPVVTHMQRNTFVCYGCNQTRTYMLPTMQPSSEAVAE
jgi:hypothetical protein